jgi:GT2 family glycosyltransferase
MRPHARGKALFAGGEKLYVRGVTYGTFAPDADGGDFPPPDVVERDFALMAANGVNSVRTYTVPPRWLLDLAHEQGLWVMVGVPWEQHVTFLDEAGRKNSIVKRLREGVRSCAGHPAVLCYAIGNEIPASVVRWHGRQRIERFLWRLYQAAKKEDPQALVTYVNYPSTEYLQLDFVDLVCFNVFLESGPQFEAYTARLQNIAGDRPLVVTETGLDSRRHSEEAQARALDWQVRSAFAAGCAGVFVFSWTDEWHRGGFDIDDWDFGLVDRDREAKLGLATVSRAFSELPFPNGLSWPRVSVVVCAYNAERTLPECLESLRQLNYPDFEVIVVNDGSTDRTAEVAQQPGVRVINTENHGLARARNSGLDAATGEIVAYIDADAYPDPHWLNHLAAAFMRSSHVGIGGPNIPPLGDGNVADCVANAPGGPCHVLVSDLEAEHIPGCNMAFRKASLDTIGGFDPQFCIAGDDVDICWRLQDQGWTVGFSPGAVVWHHRRNSVRAYFKQQYEYGKAEALLERKFPARYNRVGHLAWTGRVYGGAAGSVAWRRWKVYYGRWGSGLFQSVYQRAPGALASLALVPEWYLVLLSLAAVALLGIHWAPLLLALPVLAVATGALAYESVQGAARASFARSPRPRLTQTRLRALTGSLFMLQPFARLSGRLRYGLAPWRRRGAAPLVLPIPRTRGVWSELWQSADDHLHAIEARLRERGGGVLQGSDWDRWDLQARGGILGVARLRMAVEEHGGGRQMLRFRLWPKFSRIGIGLTLSLGALAVGAGLAGAWIALAVLGTVAVVLAVTSVKDCSIAMGMLLATIQEVAEASKPHLLESAREVGLHASWIQTASALDGKAGQNGHESDGNGLRELPSANSTVRYSEVDGGGHG